MIPGKMTPAQKQITSARWPADRRKLGFSLRGWLIGRSVEVRISQRASALGVVLVVGRLAGPDQARGVVKDPRQGAEFAGSALTP